MFSLQRILGHTTLDMVKRYVALAELEIVRRIHAVASPADRLLIGPKVSVILPRAVFRRLSEIGDRDAPDGRAACRCRGRAFGSVAACSAGRRDDEFLTTRLDSLATCQVSKRGSRKIHNSAGVWDRRRREDQIEIPRRPIGSRSGPGGY